MKSGASATSAHRRGPWAMGRPSLTPNRYYYWSADTLRCGGMSGGLFAQIYGLQFRQQD